MQIEFCGDHLEVRHEKGFVITPRGMKDIWAEMSVHCREHRCGKVLVMADAPQRNVGVVDAFESGVEASNVFPGLMVAIFFANYEPDETSELFVTAARNRGVRVKFFSDRATALRWLGVGK